MSIMTDKEFPRIECGIPVVDEWVDDVATALERCLNITATGGIQAYVGPHGISLALALKPNTRIGKASSSGIPARVGTTLGKATDVVLYDLTEGVLASEGITDIVYNMSSVAVAAGAYIVMTRIGKHWIVQFEDCSA